MQKKDIFFVGVQFILFALFLFLNAGTEMGKYIFISGVIVAALGAIVILISLLQLNKNLSPFPTPKNNGELVTSGLYSFVRHPIYLGILVLFLGCTIATGSWIRVVITLTLGILFHYKSEYEEALLSQKFPAYEHYKKTTSKIIPFL